MSRFSFFDVLLFAGFASLCYGLWLAWHPAAFILGGILLIVFSVLTERGRAAERAQAARRGNS
jgi:predicted ABC-type exoprotein transport system permease subunit